MNEGVYIKKDLFSTFFALSSDCYDTLLYLISECKEDNYAHKTIDEIAEETSNTPLAVEKAVEALRDCGFIAHGDKGYMLNPKIAYVKKPTPEKIGEFRWFSGQVGL